MEGVKKGRFWAILSVMSSSVRKILDEVQRLPKQDRALLRAELAELDDEASEGEVEAAWDEELARRVQSIKDGAAVLYDHEEVMRELEEIVKR